MRKFKSLFYGLRPTILCWELWLIYITTYSSNIYIRASLNAGVCYTLFISYSAPSISMISSKDPLRYWPGFSAPGLALYGASRRQKRGRGRGGLRRSMEREREGRVRTGMKYRRGRREARNSSLIFSSAVNRWSHAKNRSMASPNLAHDINSPETNRFSKMIPLGLSRSIRHVVAKWC